MPFFLIAFLKFKHKNRYKKSRSSQKKSGLKNIKIRIFKRFFTKNILTIALRYDIIESKERG